MYIASIGTDARVHTWPKGQLLHTYKSNNQGSMKTLSWDKDGSWLILVPNGGPAEVISVRGNLKHLHSVHKIQQPTCAAFQNGTRRNIALGTTAGIVFVYDVKWNNIRKRFPNAPSTVFKVEYCTKDSFLVAACKNGEILLYNSITYDLSLSFKVPGSKSVSNVRCHPVTGDLVLGGSQEGIVAMWDIHSTKLIFNNQAHSAPVMDLTFSPHRSDLLVTIGLDRKLKFFETGSNRCVMQKVMEKSPTAIDFCPDGVGLAVALQDGTIQTCDTRQMKNPLYVFTAHGGQIKQLLFQKKALEETCELTSDKNKIPSDVKLPQPKEVVRSGYCCDSPAPKSCGDFLPDIPEATTEASTEEAGDTSLQDSLCNTLSKTSSNGPSEDIGKQKLLHAKSIFSKNETQVTSSNSNRQDNESKSSQKVSTSAVTTDDVKVEKSTSKFVKDSKSAITTDDVKVETSTSKFVKDCTSAITTDDVKVETSTSKFVKPKLSPSSNSSPNTTVSQYPTKSKLCQADTEMIRSIVREELKQEIDTLKEDLKYEHYDTMGFIRQHFIDLEMFVVKEFTQVGHRFNELREDISDQECFKEDLLMQENINLRKEVRTLQNQLISKNDD